MSLPVDQNTSLRVTIRRARLAMNPYTTHTFYGKLPKIRNLAELTSHLISKSDRVGLFLNGRWLLLQSKVQLLQSNSGSYF